RAARTRALAGSSGGSRRRGGSRIFGLRVLVEPLQVGVSRSGIEIKVVLLDVLAVVTLGAREAEITLLQDGVAPVPESHGEAEALVVVGDAENAILAPAIGARAGMVVREVVPGRAVGGIIFPHCPPLPVGQVRAPAQPLGRARARLLEPSLLRRHRRPPPAHRVVIAVSKILEGRWQGGGG